MTEHDDKFQHEIRKAISVFFHKHHEMPDLVVIARHTLQESYERLVEPKPRPWWSHIPLVKWTPETAPLRGINQTFVMPSGMGFPYSIRITKLGSLMKMTQVPNTEGWMFPESEVKLMDEIQPDIHMDFNWDRDRWELEGI